MTYKLYRYRTMFGQFEYYAATREPMSREEVVELKRTMYDTIKKTTYTTIIVCSAKEQEFLDKCERKAKYVAAETARMEKIKERRWAIMDEAYRQGYQVRDAIEYLNRK